MTKTSRKNIHQGTKKNFRRQNCQRVQTTNMKRKTEPVPRASTATATAIAEVTGIPAPEEGPWNGFGFLTQGREQERWALWQRLKYPRQQLREKNSKLRKSRDKIAQNGKSAQKLMKNLPKNAGQKSGGLLMVQQPKPLGRLGRIRETHV